jgi:hypothetical protein
LGGAVGEEEGRCGDRAGAGARLCCAPGARAAGGGAAKRARSGVPTPSAHPAPSFQQVSLAGQQAASYGACLTVNDSDHKPVYCLLDVTLPAFNQVRAWRSPGAGGGSWERRRLGTAPRGRWERGGGGAEPRPPIGWAAPLAAGLVSTLPCASPRHPHPPQEASRDAGFTAIAAAAAAAPPAPRIQLQPATVRLDPGAGGFIGSTLLLNGEDVPLAFAVAGADGGPRALPAWLDASPAAGVLPPGGGCELTLRAAGGGGGGSGSAALLVTAAAAGGAAAAAWPAPDLGSAAPLQVSLADGGAAW